MLARLRERPRPGVMLTVSVLGQSASSAAVNGPAFLIPALHAEGMSLAQAGWIAAATIAGATATLYAWGALVDRLGERTGMLLSLVTTAVALVGAAFAADVGTVPLIGCLFLAGLATAGTSSASGRMVVGWFPPHRRGAAMGFRQMAQPLGVGVAAVAVPVVAARVSPGAALGVLAAYAGIGLVACAFTLVDPHRPALAAGTRPTSPYGADAYLLRVHAASILLVIPQITLWTFQLVWLQVDQGWSPEAAGTLVAVTQLVGGGGRIVAGAVSDRMGSRMRPLRAIAVLASATMLALGIAAGQAWAVAVPLVVAASVITVADNGLAFTAVAERAGPWWSGRALGLQNTGQYLVGTAVPPAIGLAVATLGYGTAFALTAAFPLLAAPLLPRADVRHRHDHGHEVADVSASVPEP